MNRILQIFERPRVLLPVIHACDEAQVIDQAVLAKKCGADGVFIINQGGLDVTEVLDVAALLTAQIPGWFVGVNLLGVDPVDALAPLSKRPWIRGLWADDADAGMWERRRVQWSSGVECERLFFGGVAFKGQRRIHSDHYGAVAKGAAICGVDVVTTSGQRTGTPPEVSKVAVMREALGDHALALASGVTPENVGLFLSYVDAFLVATGIEREFGDFDPARLSELAATIHAWAPTDRVRLGTPLEHPCPDCGAQMVLRNSVHGPFYGCRSYPRCKATHGAHKATGQPLGTPADQATKRERIAAHALFDQLWKGKVLRGGHRGHPDMDRGEAYAWMAEKMAMTKDEAHIGRFDAGQCRRLQALVQEHFPGLTPPK